MSAPVDILTITDRYRDALIAREEEAVARLIDAYSDVRAGIEDDLSDITALIESRRQRELDVSESWLRRQARYQALLERVDAEVSALARDHRGALTAIQAEAVGLSNEAFAAAVAVQGAELARRLPPSAFAELVGRLSNGSPLADLLDELGPDARQRVERALLDGVVRGMSPRETARLVSDAMGGNMAKALQITRDQTIAAYRGANHRQFQANADILESWIWSAQLDDRVCASCMAQHGLEFPITEPLASHSGCRCAQVPKVRGSNVGFQRGTDWFAQQPESRQLQLLGPAKFNAWRDGAIRLDDLIARGTDPRWGPWTREASLVSLLGDDARRYYRRLEAATA